jgi:hypothetical protein
MGVQRYPRTLPRTCSQNEKTSEIILAIQRTRCEDTFLVMKTWSSEGVMPPIARTKYTVICAIMEIDICFFTRNSKGGNASNALV